MKQLHGTKAERAVVKAMAQLMKALEYDEHSGHNMSKSGVRRALETLGVPLDEQP